MIYQTTKVACSTQFRLEGIEILRFIVFIWLAREEPSLGLNLVLDRAEFLRREDPFFSKSD